MKRSKHLLFNIPINNYNPAIAKIKKKKSRTINESNNKRIAENKDVRITLSDFMLEIVLSGLRTRRTLNELNPLFYPPIILGNQAVNTIAKSKIFQLSLKYAYFEKIKPIPMILILISVVYR